jgi:hypothetical protein
LSSLASKNTFSALLIVYILFHFITNIDMEYVDLFNSQNLMYVCLFQVDDIIMERNRVLKTQMESLKSIDRSENVFLRATHKSTTRVEAIISQELKALTTDADCIQYLLKELAAGTSDGLSMHVHSMTSMISQLTARLKSLSATVKEQTERSMSSIVSQTQALEEFAETEKEDMRKTAEEMIKVLNQYCFCLYLALCRSISVYIHYFRIHTPASEV